MPRGDNFRGKPGRGRRKGVSNKITPEVREAARLLVEDGQYCANLRARMRAGTAGQMEVLLWRYAYGKPRDAEPEGRHEARLEAMRAAVRSRLAQDPLGAQVMDRLVQGASLEQALRAVGYGRPALTSSPQGEPSAASGLTERQP